MCIIARDENPPCRNDFSHSVEAFFHYQQVRGGTASYIARCSNGKHYVVKSRQNPQGPRLLFNEALGTSLAQAMGLPVPQWSPVNVSSMFLERYGSRRKVSEEYTQKSGLHFGSQLAFTVKDEVIDYLPPGWTSSISNRSAFLGILIFDIWVQHTDNRHAVFIRKPGRDLYRACFVDFGHCFGGPQVPAAEPRSEAGHPYRFYRPGVYSNLWKQPAVNMWKQRVKSISENDLRSMTARIPDQWRSDISHVENTIEALCRRKDNYDLIETMAEQAVFYKVNT